MLRRVTSEGSSKIFKFLKRPSTSLRKRQNKLNSLWGVIFNFFGGSRGKSPLRRVAKALKSLRRVTPEGSAKIKKTGYFTALKSPKAVHLT